MSYPTQMSYPTTQFSSSAAFSYPTQTASRTTVAPPAYSAASFGMPRSQAVSGPVTYSQPSQRMSAPVTYSQPTTFTSQYTAAPTSMPYSQMSRGVSSRTVVSSGASFAPGQRIEYAARSNGRKYAGSVIGQTPTGGLKIQLDGGGIKEISPADLSRVSSKSMAAATPRSTPTTYGAVKTYSAPAASISAPVKTVREVQSSATRITQSALTQSSPSTAALLAQGQIVSEKVLSIDECYGTGLVRAEGEIPIATPPPVAYEVQRKQQAAVDEVVRPAPQAVYEQVQPVQEPETVVVEEQVVASGGDVVEVAQTLVDEPRPPVAVIVATSGAMLGEAHHTGAWLEEIAGPYYVFLEAGCEVHLASTMGGAVPIDETSMSENFFTETAQRLVQEYPMVLQESLQIGQISPEQLDIVFLAGGHGVYEDFEQLAQFITDANVMGKVIGAVCHGPVGLVRAIAPNEEPLIRGRQVTGFSNEEEAAVGLDQQVPFLLESQMMELGANFSKGEPWTEYAVRDGNLVTGQNPQSSVLAATYCVEALSEMLNAPQM